MKGYWITKEGKAMLIAEMDNKHLNNSINMLKKNVKILGDGIEACGNVMSSLGGEYASIDAERACDEMIEARARTESRLLELEDEESRRRAGGMI